MKHVTCEFNYLSAVIVIMIVVIFQWFKGCITPVCVSVIKKKVFS